MKFSKENDKKELYGQFFVRKRDKKNFPSDSPREIKTEVFFEKILREKTTERFFPEKFSEIKQRKISEQFCEKIQEKEVIFFENGKNGDLRNFMHLSRY